MATLFDMLSDFGPKILGGKKYDTWKEERFSLITAEIKNKKLAKELETACAENDGFLTYSEYLQVDQFGKNGYHANHTAHGFTPTFTLWPKAIYKYIRKHTITNIIEMGPGNGKLFQEVVKLAKKDDYKFTWYGVEVSKDFREQIKKRIKDKNYLGGVFETAGELPNLSLALIVSSFCLDSIPPEIIINTHEKEGMPNAVVGLQIKNGMLQECVLEKDILRKKGITIENGILKKGNISYDFSNWKLTHLKRFYAHICAFEELYNVIQKTTDSHLLTIDEVRSSIKESYSSDCILPPVFLSVKNRFGFSSKKSYARAGELLLYYPLFLPALISFLTSVGFKNITYAEEPKAATDMMGEVFQPKKSRKSLCYGVVAKKTGESKIEVSFKIPMS